MADDKGAGKSLLEHLGLNEEGAMERRVQALENRMASIQEAVVETNRDIQAQIDALVQNLTWAIGLLVAFLIAVELFGGQH